MLKPDFAYSAIWLDLANRRIGMGSHLQGLDRQGRHGCPKDFNEYQAAKAALRELGVSL